MRQLTAAEARFLYSDSDHSNSNITLVQIYAPAPRTPRPRFKWLLAHVASRLSAWPPFREKLLRVPLDLDRPYWVDDERFDLEYHVRHIALPQPGDWRQFCIQASRIHARPLDLSRPLWELYLVEGLDSIDELPRHSFGILCKVHHAAINLSEGADLAVLLHDDAPRAADPAPPEPWFPEKPPDVAPLVMRALANNVIDPLAALKRVTRSVSEAGPAVIGFAGEAIRHPERFPTARFNAEVSPHRVFETRRFTLDDFARIRRLVRGASIDDAVLAVCGGALRRYLEFHEELPQASLVALAPQSVHGTPPRSSREIDRLHRVALGTDCADPRERLRIVHAAAAHAAEQQDRERGEAKMQLAESAPAFALALAARGVQAAALAAARGVPIANCTIANLPGPSRPLYLGTARMNYFSAMMPIADGLGLTFAVTHYEGQLVISPTACREQVPDPEFLALCIRDSFEEYAKLAAPRRVSSPRKRSRSGAKRARRAPRA